MISKSKGKPNLYTLEDHKDSEYKALKIDQQGKLVIAKIKKMKMIQIKSHSPYWTSEEREAELFMLQAKFMEDFEDSCKVEIPFECIKPTYDKMTNMQLRCYFTWRTHVRQGIVNKTSLSYVYVYIFELINNIGVSDPMDMLHKLLFIYRRTSCFVRLSEQFIFRWIKDYYICNNFDISFKEVVELLELQSNYPEIYSKWTEENLNFTHLSRLSKYNYENSSYKNKALFENCFNQIIKNMVPLFALYGFDWNAILSGRIEQQHWWPFKDAIYCSQENDKEVAVSPQEFYRCSLGRWYCFKPQEKNAVAGELIKFIIDGIEAQLRIETGYSDIIFRNVQDILDVMHWSGSFNPHFYMAVEDADFGSIIAAVTKECYHNHKNGVSNQETLSVIAQKLDKLLEMPPYKHFVKAWRETTGGYRRDFNLEFCQQARILEGLQDFYDEKTTLTAGVPRYAFMTNQQLRCYFTWRTKIRNGEIENIEESYLRLYIFELINGVGVSDKEDAVKKMTEILRHYKKWQPLIERTLAVWIKEYYICSSFNYSFAEFAQKYQIQHYYPNVFINSEDEEIIFEIYNLMSKYKITESSFYNEKTKPLLVSCFRSVLDSVKKYFAAAGLDFNTVILGRKISQSQWSPFQDAAYISPGAPVQKQVIICDNESYKYHASGWYCQSCLSGNAPSTHLVGYILKRMEAGMREIMQFKKKLSADSKPFIKALSRGVVSPTQVVKCVSDSAFEKTIDKALIQFFNTKYPTIYQDPQVVFRKPVRIQVDLGQLERIRAEADQNQDKLTVIETDINQISILECDIQEDVNAVEDKQLRGDIDNPQSSGDFVGWDGFYQVLNQQQRQVLGILLSAQDAAAKLTAYSQENRDVFMEVIVESINEQALEYIYDNIIETSTGIPCIIEDYINDLQMIFQEAR